jgi:hypothetical protein
MVLKWARPVKQKPGGATVIDSVFDDQDEESQ